MTYDRRPHQKRAIADILAGFKKHDRGQFISACGTGKTLTSLWVKEDLDAQRTLVLVPSLALIDQYASEWRKHQAPDRRVATLCVCSDNTVGRQADEDDYYDNLHFTADDLIHDGFDVTSSPDRIAAFMRQAGRQVIFSTYQSSHLLEEAQGDDAVPSFDLAIADEAHRCAGDRSSIFATILDEDRIRAEKRLFATATPVIYRVKKGQEDTASALVDMSDETRFGPRFHALSMGEAIRQDLLSDYRVAIMAINESDCLFVADDKNKARQSVQVGVLKAIREYGLRRVISFHSYVKNANEFAQALPEVAAEMWPVDPNPVLPVADFVSGEMTAQVRKQKMAAFRSVEEGQCRILSNARCLTEGVDVPDIDGIVFVDPRGSPIDIVQALGRAIRKHEGKTHGTIILPVFMGKGETPGEAIENSNFKTVYGVLNALRAHDAGFETALNERRQVEGGVRPGESDPFAKIRIIGTEHVAELTKAIQLRIVGELSDDWEVGFGAAKARFAAYGDCNASHLSTWPEDAPDGFRLGRWLNQQQQSYIKNMLSVERIQRLESIGMVWNRLHSRWEEGFSCLTAYRDAHGHCQVPNATTWPEDDHGGFRLGAWLQSQRTMYKNGEGLIAGERAKRLESVGVIWNVLEESWEEGFSCLAAYRDAHGHCHVPNATTWPEDNPEGFKLGNWMSFQRQLYNQTTRGKLSAVRIQKLESIGVKWIGVRWGTGRHDSRWEKGFSCLTAYRATHGDCKAIKSATWPEDDTDGFRLGEWVRTQRKDYKGGKLSANRILKLESVGMIWRINSSKSCDKKQDINGHEINDSVPTECTLEDLVERLKDEQVADEIPEQMAQFGCDLEQSRVLVENGSYDEALELLEEATGESLRMRM